MFEFAQGVFYQKPLEVVEFLKEFPDYKLYRLFNGFIVPLCGPQEMRITQWDHVCDKA